MKPEYREVAPVELRDNAIRLIGEDWMLVTAGTPSDFNTMTASWGGLGELWNRRVAFIFVRPQRYTFQFVERSDHFTLSFFTEAYREALNFCGTHSGRNVDKMAATGLTPMEVDAGAVAFREARLILVCRKLYAQDLGGDNFVVPGIDGTIYAQKDYHRWYVGEIVQCLTREPR
jgi:flavin reductase (DIM6/NTAB) family NADH-FMN oxidoreductase RutF